MSGYPVMEPHRNQAVIAIVATILAALKRSTVPQNSPAYVAAIADAVSDVKRIAERVESPFNNLLHTGIGIEAGYKHQLVCVIIPGRNGTGPPLHICAALQIGFIIMLAYALR